MNTWFNKKSLLILAAAVLLLGGLAACGYEDGTEPGFDNDIPGGELPAAPGGDAGLPGSADDLDDDAAADDELDQADNDLELDEEDNEDDDEEDSDQ